MGEKEGKGEKEKKAADGGEKKKEGGAEKKEEGLPTVVLKVDMHCEGCASKIKRSIRKFEGVEEVTADMASNKLMVRGKVDPWMLREHVETKTRKKVEIISPVSLPKKEADAGGKKPAAGGDSKEQKKPVELAASTVVLQIRLHCDGCIQRIQKTILKVKGVQEVNVDAKKDLVTVKGTMDVNSLPSLLKHKLKRSVEIVPPKAAAAAAASGGEKKAEGGGGGEKKEEGGGGEKKKEGGGGSGGGEGGGKKEETVKMAAAAAMATPVGWGTHIMENYGTYYTAEMSHAHAPQLFSDENPNACSVM